MARGDRPKKRRANQYRVFVSHAGDDSWVASQIANRIEECGASAFLDRRDIAAGDNFRERIREELPKCDELLALFTPWSSTRAWVRHEIGMADALNKRTVYVFYKVSVDELRRTGDGLGPIDEINIIDINKFDDYFTELAKRARPPQ